MVYLVYPLSQGNHPAVGAALAKSRAVDGLGGLLPPTGPQEQEQEQESGAYSSIDSVYVQYLELQPLDIAGLSNLRV